jgi:hypothetical protein
MHRLSADDREGGRYVLDGVLRYAEVILRKDREVGELAFLDLYFLARLGREPRIGFRP